MSVEYFDFILFSLVTVFHHHFIVHGDERPTFLGHIDFDFWPFDLFFMPSLYKIVPWGWFTIFYWDGSPADISTWFATNFTHGRVQQLYCMTSSSVSFHFFPILRGTSWITGVQKRRWSRRSSWSLVQVMVTPSPSLTHISSIVNLFALALTGAFLHVELQDG